MQTDENVAITGFIITGNGAKKIIVRGIGPSLTASHIADALADPVLELHGEDGSLITSNDNWKDTQRAAIQDSGLAPTNDKESAIIAVLAPGPYTTILRGKNRTMGVGLVEMYDLNPASDSALANISTRGCVQTGNDVMIAGFLFGNGTAGEKVIIRALGPSLTAAGIINVLADPTLALHDSNGVLLMSDDNWKDDASQATQIIATGIPPKNDLESAIVTTLAPGQYTAIVRGKNSGAGVSLAEVYHIE